MTPKLHIIIFLYCELNL
uniref:Uncharacterized protein n=1 Tax=Anguilla anguilla TaxID=7936 RepID=A0A0E9U032_ANGAN